MLSYRVFGAGNVFSSAFPDPVTGDLDLDVVSASATQTVFRQPESGFTTTFTGTGLSTNPEASLTGTVTGIVIRNAAGDVVGEFTGMSWSAQAIGAALTSGYDDGNWAPYGALLSLQPVTIDLGGRTAGFTAIGGVQAPFISSGVTHIGSSFGDTFHTGTGDDIVRIGGAPFGGTGEQIYASAGNDTYDFSGVLPRSANGGLQNAWIDLVYHSNYGTVAGPITVTLDGAANTGRVTGPAGTHTLIDVRRAIADSDGFGIYGTGAGDAFVVRPGVSNGFLTVAGYGGADSYDLTLDGTVRLSFRTGYLASADRPVEGAVVDLTRATAQVQNDGFGNVETVMLRDGSGWLELEGTDNADRLTGSGRDERFRPRAGDDTLDGGGGVDQVRYDYSGVSGGVTIDLAAGTATGQFAGTAFSQTLRNIENVRFGRPTAYNDTVRGDDGANLLDGSRVTGTAVIEGRGGDDTLWGGSGGDTLVGGAGNDTLYGRAGTDTAVLNTASIEVTAVRDGAGFILRSVDGEDRLEGVERVSFTDGVVDTDDLPATGGVTLSGAFPAATNDLLTGTRGADRLDGLLGDDTLIGGAGDDILRGDAGNDSIRGGDGADTLNGGDGDDVILGGTSAFDLRDVIYGGLGNDRIDAGHGNDQVFGGDGNDTVEGGFGVDEIIGQGGDDVLTGSAFSDLIFGGDGNDFINGGFVSDRVNGGAGADRFYHLGIADHGSDWIQDYSAAGGDVLVWGGGAATRSQFQVNTTQTAGAGAAGVDEAFVIYRPTGQILGALVDGDAQGAINLQIGGQVFDLLA